MAEDLGVREVMLIRVKPVGRCENSYEELKLSEEQLRRLDVYVKSLLKYDVGLRVDCAFMPFLSIDENVMVGMQDVTAEFRA